MSDLAAISIEGLKKLFLIKETAFENRISNLVIEQLRNGAITEEILVWQVVNEIRFLEGLKSKTSTKAHQQFDTGSLIGLFYKHWTQPSFLAQNIKSELGLGPKQNKRGFNRILWETLKKSLEPQVFSETLAERLVNETLDKRSESGLTGEWIIFAKYKGLNYYLTLALHTENKSTIFERIAGHCHAQFPFLFA